MRTRQVHNVQTGEITNVEVDDAWMFANRQALILLSASSLNVAVNGTITLSAQAQQEKADYSFQDVLLNRTVQIQLGELLLTVSLVNGFWQDAAVSFVLAGTYQIFLPFIFDEANQVQNLASNVLTVTVV